VRLLLFDLDGTVLRSVQGSAAFHAAVHDVFGVEVDLHAMRPDGKTDPMIVRELLRARGVEVELDRATLEVFETCLAERMSAALTSGIMRVEAIPGVRAVLEALAGDPGCALAVLTGNLERAARLKLRAAALNGFFAVGAFGSDSAVRAELPDVVRTRFRARTGIDVPPSDCVIIGDTPLDHAAATANGMPSVLIASGRTPLAELACLTPATTFPDWNDAAAIQRALGAS